MITIERQIPSGSEVVVALDQNISHLDIVATQSRQGELVRVLIADQLKISPHKVLSCLEVAVGQRVNTNDLLARFKAFFGLIDQSVFSYCDGIIERFVPVDGTIEIRTDPEVVDTKSFVEGTICAINHNSVSILVNGIKINGSIGFGDEVVAPMTTLERLNTIIQPSVLIVKHNSDLLSVLSNTAMISKIKGVVVYQLENEIAKSITNCKHPLVQSGDTLPFSVIVLDKFGNESMPSEIFNQLTRDTVRNVSIFPKTQIRAGGSRPFLVVT